MKRLRILKNLGKNPSNGMTGRLRRCILNWNSFRTEWIPTCSELKVENPMWIFERWCGIAAFCLHFRRLFFHLCCICVAFVLHLCCICVAFIKERRFFHRFVHLFSPLSYFYLCPIIQQRDYSWRETTSLGVHWNWYWIKRLMCITPVLQITEWME